MARRLPEGQGARWHRAAGLLFSLLLTAIAGPSAASDTTDSCVHTIITAVPSPDGAWTAEVNEAVCEGGPMASAVVDSVRLKAADGPGHGADLLGLQSGGTARERPRLAWTGARTLQVTVPNLSFLRILARRYESVAIDLRFDPPDPAARAAWLRALGLPPDYKE
jgi:hypothetical protein